MLMLLILAIAVRCVRIDPVLSTRCLTAFSPAVFELLLYFMQILVHTGFKLGGIALIPQILPNTCEMMQVMKSAEVTMWPCIRDQSTLGRVAALISLSCSRGEPGRGGFF